MNSSELDSLHYKPGCKDGDFNDMESQEITPGRLQKPLVLRDGCGYPYDKDITAGQPDRDDPVSMSDSIDGLDAVDWGLKEEPSDSEAAQTSNSTPISFRLLLPCATLLSPTSSLAVGSWS